MRVAGVTEEGPAEAAIDFAVRFELLRKDEASRLRLVEVDYSDYDDIAASIPTCVCDATSWAAPTDFTAPHAAGIDVCTAKFLPCPLANLQK